jgi:penicillin-binding protein 2
MLNDKRDLHAVFNRRALLLGGVGAGAFGLVGVRMLYLQAEDLATETYTDGAIENRFDQRIVTPPRGILYDRFGVALAVTSPDYRVVLVPEQVGRDNLEATVAKIGEILGLEPAVVERRLRDARQAKPSEDVIIRQALRWDQFSAINVRLPELPGVRAESRQIRRYPFDIAFAHPLGYVQKPSQRDVDAVLKAGDDRRAVYYRNPDVRVGKSGLEVSLEAELHGEAGWRMVEVNAAGRVVNEVGGETKQPKPGGDVVLTLDAECQRTAMERMRGESASCVVMDIYTGDLIVLASSPGFDPNEFINGISFDRFKALNEDPYKPLFHKAVTGLYKPGSTFKIATGLAAIDAGMAENYTVNCPGYVWFGGRRFHCWKRGGHGPVGFHMAMKQSCNCFFFNAGLLAGQQKVADTARLLGFQKRYDIGLPLDTVGAGIIPDEAWWKTVRKDPMPAGMTLNTAIGQGDVLTSPLQLAVMTARVANGGLDVAPRLVRDGRDVEPPPTPNRLPISDAALKRVMDGIFGVCNEPGGTALGAAGNLDLMVDPSGSEVREAALAPAGWKPVQLGGKTGTAQVRVITVGERAAGVKRNEDLPWNMRDHALFVCHGPIHKPRYACAVVVEHGGGGSRVAAPIARDVMRQVILRDPSNKPGVTRETLAAQAGQSGLGGQPA